MEREHRHDFASVCHKVRAGGQQVAFVLDTKYESVSDCLCL